MNYENFSPARLLTIVKSMQKIIQAFFNRGEEIDRILAKTPDKTLTCEQFGAILNKIDAKHPIILGELDE